MVNKEKSEQETILKWFSELAIGSRLVFKPDNYGDRKDKEPVDRVWVCNNCVFLIYMKGNLPGESSRRLRTKFETSDEGNLKQAAGWLRFWKNGVLLTGKSDKTEFSIKYSDVKHIFVLSIVGSDHDIARVCDDFAIKHGISGCATLPQSVFQEFLKWGGTPADLLKFLSAIRQGGSMTKNEALATFRAILMGNMNLAHATKYWGFQESPDDYLEARKIVDGLRTLSDDKVVQLLNDIRMVDFLKIVTQIRTSIDDLRTKVFSYICIQGYDVSHYAAGTCCIELENYTAGLTVACGGLLPALQKVSFKHFFNWWHLTSLGKMRPGPRIFYCADFNAVWAMAHPREGPSITELFAERFRQRLAKQS
jgi:hypothetical protein